LAESSAPASAIARGTAIFYDERDLALARRLADPYEAANGVPPS
jgi:hypothetical protein